MTEYEFILKFRLPDADVDPERFVGPLMEAGCDDATIGIGQRGRIALDFTRTAASAMEAVVSAIADVKKGVPGAELVEASPDLVGLSDVAELLGCSRQNIRKLMVTHAATFPTPAHEGTQSIWHLHPILDWFIAQQKRAIDATLVELSDANMKVNVAKEVQRLPGASVPAPLDSIFA